MDPNQTLLGLLISIQSADTDQAIELAEALAEWIDRDGFEPEALQICVDTARRTVDGA